MSNDDKTPPGVGFSLTNAKLLNLKTGEISDLPTSPPTVPAPPELTANDIRMLEGFWNNALVIPPDDILSAVIRLAEQGYLEPFGVAFYRVTPAGIEAVRRWRKIYEGDK